MWGGSEEQKDRDKIPTNGVEISNSVPKKTHRCPVDPRGQTRPPRAASRCGRADAKMSALSTHGRDCKDPRCRHKSVLLTHRV